MSRDISELKARLGLKKGPAKKTGSIPAPKGLVPPPGIRPASIPAPPGAEPPQPQLPSAAEDPFAAMNALAAAGTAQKAARGPEIIVVESGGPVESVEKSALAVKYGKIAGIVLLPLFVGFIVGQINSQRKATNRSIETAEVLAKDVKQLRGGVQGVVDALLVSREKTKDGTFLVNDKDLTEALAQVSLPKVRDAKGNIEVFKDSLMDNLNEELVAHILEFYSEYMVLREDVLIHVETSRSDAKAMDEGVKNRAKGEKNEDENRYLPTYRYGVYIDIPSKADAEKGKMFGAQLVEFGRPVCEDRKPAASGKCPGPVLGFEFRTTGAGSDYGLKSLAQALGDSVGGDKLIPLTQNEAMDQLLKGGGASAAEIDYQRRVENIEKRAKLLVELGVSVEGRLLSKVKEGKGFAI